MRLNPFHREQTPEGTPTDKRRTPRVAVARRIEPERPARVWSLLLPPTFPPERK